MRARVRLAWRVMSPLDPTSIVAAAVTALGVDLPARLDVRPARGAGDWFTPVPARLRGLPPVRSAPAVAEELRNRPEVTWANPCGVGVTFSVRTQDLVPILATATLRSGRNVGLQRNWPADLWHVAFAHARTRNLSRAALRHAVPGVPQSDHMPQAETVVAEPHARELLIHVATLTSQPQADRLLLRSTAHLFQQWFAGTRITPRAREPVTSYHRIRLALNEATGNALAAGLASLGFDAPEHL